jgi:prepilin-type N-terminal cleavage/methylation domain-containing protein
MSTADLRSRRRHGAGGFTLLEMLFTLVILSMLSLTIQQTLSTTNSADRYLLAVRRATDRGDAVSYEVFDLVDASRKLFQKDPIGEGYLGALDLSRFQPVPTARLPVIDEGNDIAPDEPGSPHTGNILLFVEETDPVECVADPATKKARYIDVYRFVCIYPHETGRRLLSTNTFARDLVMWRSRLYPSYAQINAIEDPDERRNVVADLYTEYGCDRIWDPNAEVDLAFYDTDTLGTISPLPVNGPVIAEDADNTVFGRLVHDDTQLAQTDSERHHYRAVMTTLTRDDPDEWVPDGFEVKIVGASGSRKVWLHIVVESLAAAGQIAVHPNTLIVSARDM